MWVHCLIFLLNLFEVDKSDFANRKQCTRMISHSTVQNPFKMMKSEIYKTKIGTACFFINCQNPFKITVNKLRVDKTVTTRIFLTNPTIFFRHLPFENLFNPKYY